MAGFRMRVGFGSDLAVRRFAVHAQDDVIVGRKRIIFQLLLAA